MTLGQPETKLCNRTPPTAREEMDRQLSQYLQLDVFPEKHSEHQEELCLS
jgi:hypothetical protein